MNAFQQIRATLIMLNEAEAKPKAKAKSSSKSADYAEPSKSSSANFADPTSKGSLAAHKPQAKGVSPTKFGRKVGTDTTALRGVKLDPSAGDVMSRVRANFPMDHDAGADDGTGDVGMEPEPVPPTSTTLPATTGGTGLATVMSALKWHTLPSLPGYRMWIGYFRSLFNDVFGMDEKQIQVATSLTSEMSEMKNLIGYIETHGSKQDDFDLEAFDLPREMFHISNGYVYHIEDETYLVLEEQLGQQTNYYVYASPKMKANQKLGAPGRGDTPRLTSQNGN